MRRLAPFFRPLLLLAGLVAAGLLMRLMPAGGVTGLLSHEAGEHGWLDCLDLLLIGAAFCAVGVPRQVVAYACGMAAGVWIGGAVALAAQVLACAANLFWARVVARRWAMQRLRGRIERLDRALARRPFLATLTLRLLPVGNNLLLNLAAGLSSIAAAPFLLASTIGYVPQTVVFALAGAGTSLGHTTSIELAVGLFLASAALGLLLLRPAARLRIMETPSPP